MRPKLSKKAEPALAGASNVGPTPVAAPVSGLIRTMRPRLMEWA
jgi:hypothetical protein